MAAGPPSLQAPRRDEGCAAEQRSPGELVEGPEKNRGTSSEGLGEPSDQSVGSVGNRQYHSGYSSGFAYLSQSRRTRARLSHRPTRTGGWFHPGLPSASGSWFPSWFDSFVTGVNCLLHLRPMARIPPSEAVKVIDRLFPFATDPTAHPALGPRDAQKLAGILAVIDGIPAELLMIDSASLATFTEARATIRTFINESQAQGSHVNPLTGSHVRALRQVLEQCPDHAVPATVATLSFIRDQELRDGLRTDIASVETSIREADWKPATVVAGSVIEALLLWGLQQQSAATVADQVTALVTAGTMSKPRDPALEHWDLHRYIEVAAALKVIKGDTAAQLRIAKDFRNLIHPGRAIRLAQKCDRGTALAAAAGLEFVIRDLTP